MPSLGFLFVLHFVPHFVAVLDRSLEVIGQLLIMRVNDVVVSDKFDNRHKQHDQIFEEPLKGAALNLHVRLLNGDAGVQNIDVDEVVDWEATVLAVNVFFMRGLQLYLPLCAAADRHGSFRIYAEHWHAVFVIWRVNARVEVFVETRTEAVVIDAFEPGLIIVRRTLFDDIKVLAVAVL